MFAFGADDAEELLAKKSWPSTDLQATAGSILDSTGLIYWVESPLGEIPLLQIPEDLRAQFTEAQAHGSRNKAKATEIEVALKLPLKETVVSATRTSSVQFDVSEVTLDFDTNKITDVAFHKIEKVPAHHRVISTEMAFLDRAITRCVQRRPRAKHANDAISFQPQA